MSFIGFFVALICILGANLIEGGHPSALLNGPAFLIVVGGIIGAAMVQFPFNVMWRSLKRFRWLVIPLRMDFFSQAEMLEKLASVARKEGFLALDAMIEEIPDPFTAKGVQMLVDGVDKDALYDLLEAEIEKEQYDIEQTAKLYESMGGYSPTMGILGAVLGLIHAMGLLDRPDELGQGIAVAFVATIYGVAFANVLLLPFANRYKAFAHDLYNFKIMSVDALYSIAEGHSPHQIRQRLDVYTEELQ